MLRSETERTYKLLNWEGRFKDPTTESHFLAGQSRQTGNRIRVISILTGFSYLSGLYSDYIILGGSDGYLLMAIARILTFLFAILCIGSTFLPKRDKIAPIVTFLYFIAITLAECTELAIRPELSNQIIPFLVFVLISYYVFFPVRLSFQISGGIFAAILYSISLSLGTDDVSVLVLVNVIFLLVNLLGIYVVHSMSVAVRMEYHTKLELMEINGRLTVEVDERMKASDKLTEMATIDDLTQIYNRRYFINLAKIEIERARESDFEVSLLFMDIDHFKKINDTYGHSVGDEVLQKVSATIGGSIRGVDIFGRFGGEEFAILLPGCSLEHAKNKAQHICELVSELSFTINKPEAPIGAFNTTISIGVAACVPKVCDDFDTIMHYADIALYQAKEDGRNRVVVWKT